MRTQSDREAHERGLSRFLSAIRERWWVIVLTMVVLGAIGYGISMVSSPRYSATAELAYSADQARLASQALSSSETAEIPHNISNDALGLTTPSFAKRVEQAIGGGLSAAELLDSVSVAADTKLDVIEVTASGPDAKQTALVANAFAAEFVTEREHDTAAALTKAQQLLQERIDALSEEDAASSYGTALRQRLDDVAVLLSLGVKDYSVLQEATVPESPYYPNPLLNLGIGLLAGLVIGLVAAFFLDRFTRKAGSRRSLHRIMDLPVIGSTPFISQASKKPAAVGNPAVGFREGNEVLLESMQMLRANLKALGFGESKRSVLITSAKPAEGRSTLAVNLAISMALAGDRVVLVDADLRDPALHLYLDLANDRGLSDVLIDRQASWTERIQAVDLRRFVAPHVDFTNAQAGNAAPVTRFVCLTSGPAISNPSELVASGAMTDIVAELQGITDYVILDGPPLLSAPEALTLSKSVDALILIGNLSRVKADEALQVRQFLDETEVTTLGMVICAAKKSQIRDIDYYTPRPAYLD